MEQVFAAVLTTMLSGVLAVLQALVQVLAPGMPPEVPAAVEATPAEVVAVLDGDTILVDLPGDDPAAEPVRETVRYIGVDTPERGDAAECYAEEATAANVELVTGTPVVLVADTEDRDAYDRLLRYVYADGVLVNEVLVEEGYATALRIEPNTAHADAFSEAEAQARTAARGLWGACW